MEGVLHGLSSAARTLRRHGSVTLLAVLALALGIGAATAIFSVVDGVLLRPLPYPAPDRIVLLYQVFEKGARGRFSEPNYRDVAQQSRSFADVAQFAVWQESVSGGAEATRVMVGVVSAGFFDVLGVRPELGRVPTKEDLREGAAVVISHGLWQRYFGAAPDLARLRLRSREAVYAVAGVMPPSVAFPTGVDVWMPRELLPPDESRTAHNWKVVARLRDGVSLDAARGELSGIARRLKAAYGSDTWMVDAAAVPLREALTGSVRPALMVLLGAVAFLLLVACANAANLLLAQAEVRRREFAVRTALGAGRGQLARQLLAESLLLSLGGGALGVAMARWGVSGLLALEPGRLPRAGEVGMSLPVLGFALAIAALTAVGLGLITAWRASADVRPAALHEEGRSPGAAGRRPVLSALVASQVAATLVLLAGAGLLGRSLLRLLHTDPGFRTRNVLAMDVSLPTAEDTDPQRLARFHEEVLQRLGALPGVSAVGGANVTPFTQGGANGKFLVVDHPIEDIREFEALMKNPALVGEAEFRVASAGYFRALGIPLVRGRLFDEHDGPDASHAAVISASLARQRWPNADPLGRQVEFGNMDGDLRLFTIVGIVGDVRDAGLDTPARPTFYGDFRQRPRVTSDFTYFVRADGDPLALAAAARRVVTDLDPQVPPRLRTLAALRSESVADRRFTLGLLAVFGAAALLLAGLGLYGVSSFAVALRTREIGVRMALGARPGQVMRMVLAQGARPALVGAGVGLALALGLSRFMGSLVYGIAPADPVSVVGAALVFGAAAFLACLVPARRATRIDPMAALRCD
jgi:putative ABC transport system permease protein